MKIITMATLKGGAGKSINTFNIAGILAETKKVCLIDIDPQCNLSSNCGIDVSNREMLTIKDIFDNPPKMQPKATDVLIKSPIAELPNLDIIPSSILLFKTEMNMSNKGNREHILKYFIESNKDTFGAYDYIFIDTNPSMSIININAFYIADEILLSSDVSSNSISGAELFCALWDERREELFKDDNIAALIICNYDKRTNLGKDLIEFTRSEDFSKDLVLSSIIPATVKLKDTEIKHKPINILHNGSGIHKAFKDVINELEERRVL